MIVTLDGEKLNQTFESDETLQGVIETVRQVHLENRMVVGVTIDGETCTDQILNERLEQQISDLNQLDLETGDPKTIAADAFRMVAKDMADVGRDQVNIADEINAGNIAKAVTRIGEFVKAWHAVRQVIVQTSTLLQRDLTEFEYEGQPLKEHLAGLVGQLNEIKAALDAKDMVLLADLLHFEVPPLCELWTNMLNAIADEITASE